MQTQQNLPENGASDIAEDFLPITGTDYIEWYVGNALQSAHYLQSAFGFAPVAHAGLSTGIRDRESYVVGQGKIRIVLTSPLTARSDLATHLSKHGDAVRVIALTVDDATSAYEETTRRGGVSYMQPAEEADAFGRVVRSGIHSYGDVVHVFVERQDYEGVFLPGYVPWVIDYSSASAGLRYVDHMVGNVGWFEMNTWVDFYTKVMGFSQLMSFDDKEISTDYTALMSKVMSSGNGRIKFPINEPADGKKRSQVEEFLDYNGGPGVQHIALATDDILYTVNYLRTHGVEFLSIPDHYYNQLERRVGKIDEALSELKRLGILVDRDEEGYLLQIFTRPLTPRPTLFFEIIQRKGARSFGKGNFKALFEAIEREQALRGTLDL